MYNLDEVKEMNTQQSFTDIEYQGRRRKTKRDVFLEIMDRLVPWKAWVKKIEPYYYPGERGRKPIPIERMLRMLMLSVWFALSDEATEDAIYDSYAMRKFMGLTFEDGSQVPDATKLCKFRNFMNEHGLQEELFAQVQEIIRANHMEVRGGTIVDATIIEAPHSIRNKEQKRDPEMHSTRKGNNYYFGMRAHIGVDPLHGFVHTVICTPANEAECKVAPDLVRKDDRSVYGDAGYLKMDRYVKDGIDRNYYIGRQPGTFRRHYGDGLSWAEERKLEHRKSSMRCKVEYAFHVVKDLFHWRKARYKGIAKNQSMAYLLFASANLLMLAPIAG